MKKIYQPKVKEIAEEFLRILNESGFFQDYEIESTDFAYDYLCEKLTEKFIENGLDDEDGIFTVEEMDTMSREIIAGSLLEQLKKKGYLQSYADDNTEELYFLTELGKEKLKDLNKEREL